MKKIMVDTNILVDLIANRKPHSKFAIDLFIRAENKKLKLYTSSHTLATTHYLLKKYIQEKELRVILSADKINQIKLLTRLLLSLSGAYGQSSDAEPLVQAVYLVQSVQAGLQPRRARGQHHRHGHRADGQYAAVLNPYRSQGEVVGLCRPERIGKKP